MCHSAALLSPPGGPWYAKEAQDHQRRADDGRPAWRDGRARQVEWGMGCKTDVSMDY